MTTEAKDHLRDINVNWARNVGGGQRQNVMVRNRIQDNQRWRRHATLRHQEQIPATKIPMERPPGTFREFLCHMMIKFLVAGVHLANRAKFSMAVDLWKTFMKCRQNAADSEEKPAPDFLGTRMLADVIDDVLPEFS